MRYGVVERDAQKLMLGAYALDLIDEAAGRPHTFTIWRARRAALRFGVRIRIVDSESQRIVLMRAGSEAGQQGVIYITRTRNMRRFRLDLLHELGEAATRWDGVPPFICQISRHDAACAAVSFAT